MNNELMHYGVKGMKWGVQKKTTGLKARGQRASEQYVERVIARRSRLRETINGGGRRQGASKSWSFGRGRGKKQKVQRYHERKN